MDLSLAHPRVLFGYSSSIGLFRGGLALVLFNVARGPRRADDCASRARPSDYVTRMARRIQLRGRKGRAAVRRLRAEGYDVRPPPRRR